MVEGVALALAVLLAAAGAPKLWRPGHVAGALRRVFGRGRDLRPSALLVFGRLLGAWELVLATALLLVGGVVVAAAVACTFAGFTGFVVVAVRRGASCGCWASLTEGPAGGAEVARTGMLTAAAVFVVIAELTGWRPAGFGWWTAPVWAVALLAMTWLATLAGARLGPVRSTRVANRLAMRAAPTRRGRLLARLAFLMGFVHTGTKAEHDRLVGELAARQRARRPVGRRPPPPPPPLPPPRVAAP